MNDDEALAKLVAAAREERATHAVHPAWDKLAEGELSPSERAALEAEDPERYELYRPFDASTLSSFADRAFAELGAPAEAHATPAPPIAPRDPSALQPAAPLPGNVVPLASAWRRRLAFAALPLAAAAAFLLLLGRKSASPAYPEYAASWVTDERATRSGNDAPADTEREHVQASDRFELVLRPAARVTSPLAARAFIAMASAAGAPPSAPLDADVSPDGAVRVVGAKAKLFPGGPGEYRLVVVIGAPGALPAALDPAHPEMALPDEGGIRTYRASVRVR